MIKMDKRSMDIEHIQPKSNPFRLVALNFCDEGDDDCFRSEHCASDDVAQRELLTDDELDYFSQNGNNVTLFIHGYNIPYGHLGQRAPKGVETQSHCLDICRPVSSHLPSKKRHHADRLLNGTGAHNWWLHMEWNLNCATQQLDECGLSNYTRLLHIAWQGDPTSPLDFIAAVPKAENTGIRLVPLIEQLVKRHIQINVMAHSLGCHVLMALMEALSKHSITLDHVFLWQAAIPDNAFLDTRFINAHKAAKKIIILYSRSDTALGPIPEKDNVRFWQKALDVNTGLSLALCAGAIHLIDQQLRSHIESPYHLANTLVHPFSTFLKDPMLRQQFYKQWIIDHRPTQSSKSRSAIAFPSTLAAQHAHVKRHYPAAYKFLSMLLHKKPHHYLNTLQMSLRWWNSSLATIALRVIEALDQYYYPSSYKQAIGELATLVITVLISEGPSPSQAMGYCGPDTQTIEKLGTKLSLIEQDCLIDHSSMRVPSIQLMMEIYQSKLWQAHPDYAFGLYQHIEYN